MINANFPLQEEDGSVPGSADSLIFDMDGTLWDASDTYTAAWNEGFRSLNINKHMHRSSLDEIMGWEKKPTLARLLPEFSEDEREEIHQTVVEAQTELIRTRGGILY